MKTTGVILLILICLLGIYDLYAFLFLPAGSTISETLKEASLNYPGILCAACYIAGHIFSPMKSTRCAKCKGKIDGQA